MFDKSNQTYRFNGKQYENAGTIRVRVLIDDTHITYVDAGIVHVNFSLLICHDTLIRLRLRLDASNDTITSTNNGWKINLTRKYGHLDIDWPSDILFNLPELRKIHRHLFHTHSPIAYFNC